MMPKFLLDKKDDNLTCTSSCPKENPSSSLLPSLPTLIAFYLATYALNLEVTYNSTFSLIPHIWHIIGSHLYCLFLKSLSTLYLPFLFYNQLGSDRLISPEFL